jgi:hypothetical protein
MIKKIQQLPRGVRWFVAAHVGAVAMISVASWWVGEHLAEHPTEKVASVVPVPSDTSLAAKPLSIQARVEPADVRSRARPQPLAYEALADHHDAPSRWSFDTQGRVVMAQPEVNTLR